MTSRKSSEVFTVGEAVQHLIGKRWLDATVEALVEPGWVRIRLKTGRKQTLTMPASCDRLRKWGEK